VKPNVFFSFGQELPDEFEEREMEVFEADLMLVLCTSLKVAPCSRLPLLVREGVSRVLISNEKVGDMGSRDQDVCILGGCDDGVRQLADALGWRDELESLWEEIVASKVDTKVFEEGPSLDECIEKLVNGMKDRMMVPNGHKRLLENHLNEKLEHSMAKKLDP